MVWEYEEGEIAGEGMDDEKVESTKGCQDVGRSNDQIW